MRATALRGLMALAVLAGSAVASGPSAQRAGAEIEPEKVLILANTVTGGASSIEAVSAAALGYAVEVASDAQWSAKTTADFSTYRALILGDPTCGWSGAIAAATANAATWGQAVDGNVILVGTDPVYHHSQGGRLLTEKGVGFATAQEAKTGAYITLSCYYHDAAPQTPVPLLDGIRPGAFTVTGVGCHNNAHIVATHPALEGLTDATLSNWGCSVHEGFDSWPADFAVLALARNVGSSFTATDGTVGTPYILASGDGLASVGLSLTPSSANVATGALHTVTAQLFQGTTAVPDRKVVFGVTAGPDTGVTGSCSTPDCLTGADGRVSWTFTNAGTTGDDTVTAFADSNGNGSHDAGEPTATALARIVVPPNSAPAFVDPTPANGAVLQATLGTEIRTTVRASDPDADDIVTVEATGLPSGATFTLAGHNPATGEFVWTPAAVGDVTMTFTATDRLGVAAPSRTVSIHVNAPPTFIDPTPTAAEVDLGQRLDFTAAASDANGEDTVNLGALGLPTGATFSPAPGNPASAAFSWTPSTGSDATVTLHATDPLGLVATRSIPIHVNDPPQFLDPTPANGAVLQATLGTEIRTTVKASDPDADDIVTVAATGLPPGATFTAAGHNPAAGEFAWTPAAVGDITMTLSATDRRGITAAPRTVSIHVNAPPAFLDPTPASAEVNLGRRLDFTVAASDANGEDTVNLGALGLPSGATFSPTPGNPASGTFSWTPSTGSDATVTLRATDPRGLVTTHPVPIHVNDPPRFAAPTPPSGSTLPGPIDVHEDVHFKIKATDADNDTVHVVDVQGLTGATITRVGSTNEFDVTWPAAAPGTYSVVVLTTDREIGTAGAFVSRRSFKILVRTPTTLTGTPAVAEMPSATHYAEMVDGQPSFGVMVQGIWFGYLAAKLATETEPAVPIAGRVVEFDVKGTKGLATTRADGWAVLEDLNLAMAAVQHGSYTAKFAGDTLYDESDDAPGLVTLPAPPPTG